MNLDLIKSILTVIGASIPLIISIVSLFRSQMEKVKGTLDSSLKIVSIKRYPLEKIPWNLRINWKNLLFKLIPSLIYLALYQFVVIPYTSTVNPTLIHVIYFFSIVFLFGIYLNPLSIFLFQNTYYIRYLYFKYADIFIDSDYHYLFNKCYKVCTDLRFDIVEVSETLGYIEANRRRNLAVQTGDLRIKVKVKKLERSVSSYEINLDFLTNISISKRSGFTNSFINQLLNNPKDAQDKPKTDMSADVFD